MILWMVPSSDSKPLNLTWSASKTHSSSIWLTLSCHSTSTTTQICLPHGPLSRPGHCSSIGSWGRAWDHRCSHSMAMALRKNVLQITSEHGNPTAPTHMSNTSLVACCGRIQNLDFQHCFAGKPPQWVWEKLRAVQAAQALTISLFIWLKNSSLVNCLWDWSFGSWIWFSIIP